MSWVHRAIEACNRDSRWGISGGVNLYQKRKDFGGRYGSAEKRVDFSNSHKEGEKKGKSMKRKKKKRGGKKSPPLTIIGKDRTLTLRPKPEANAFAKVQKKKP